MKTQKIIRYSMPVTRRFPSNHRRKGEPTYFVEKINNAINNRLISYGIECIDGKDIPVSIDTKKLHTIRNNKNNVWTKRMKKVLDGKAVIDLFYWKLPGGRWTKGNERIVFATLDKDSGCGMQEIKIDRHNGCIGAFIKWIGSSESFTDEFVKLFSSTERSRVKISELA